MAPNSLPSFWTRAHVPFHGDHITVYEGFQGVQKPGKNLKPIWTPYANAASILIVIPVEDVMAAILNAPMAPIGGKNLLGDWLVMPWAVSRESLPVFLSMV